MSDHDNTLRLAISSVHLADRSSLLAGIAHARNLGFWGVELFGNEIVSGYLTDRAALDTVRETAQHHGITMTVHPWFDWTELAVDDAAQALKQVLERCYRLEAPYVNIHLNFLSTPAHGVERVASIVRPVLPYFERSGITLCFENVPAILANPLGAQPQEFLTFFDLLDDHPHIGLTIDTGHANISGNLLDFIDQLGGKWMYTHLADNHGDQDEHLGSGMGSTDWEGFVQGLVSTGYGGPLIVEFNERYLKDAQVLLESIFRSAGWRWPQLAV